MSLFIKQDESRSKLQQEIAAELQAKAKKRQELADMPDGVSDSQYIVGTKKTTSLAWIWVIIVVAIVVLAVWLVFKSS